MQVYWYLSQMVPYREGNVTLSLDIHKTVNCFSYVWNQAQFILALGRTTQSPADLVINVHYLPGEKKGSRKVNVANIFAVFD